MRSYITRLDAHATARDVGPAPRPGGRVAVHWGASDSEALDVTDNSDGLVAAMRRLVGP